MFEHRIHQDNQAVTMLTNDIKTALKSYTANMTRTVTLVLQTGEHAKRDELVSFLTDFASISDKVRFEQRDLAGQVRSPLSFVLEVDNEPNGIVFSGIPGGHEFNSLVLAVLQSAGTPLKLDESIQKIITGVQEDLHFEVFVSLSCHNCPDVVQALNQFALLNPHIRTEMIEGGVFQDVIESRNIQGVPTVYLNGEVFANGKIDTAKLLEKLIEKYPGITQGSQTGEQLPVQDVTVIGGGPAGVAAAIYAARKGLKVTMVADRIGGQVKDTLGIENLISVPKTTGPELAGALQQHMDDYTITKREHLRVDRIEKGALKTVHLSSGESFETKTLIIATGAKWRELGVPGEQENIGNGVAYCPHCDGPFFKGKDVAVIGGGNSGIEAALDLAGIVKSVTVFEFLPELKADQVLVKQAEARDNITILKNVATRQIIADNGKVTAIEYQDRETEQVRTQDLAGVFVQIGLVPNSAFLKDVVEMTRFGEVVINEKGETSEPGIFACGDVTTVPYKQIVIAMGEGAKASLAAFEYLLKH
ncbi:alkyl hydroperoxide reductase subunit F [Gynuella sunshinyii]|uniref:Alkyl hydroperoxide reductase subunit F n=1 Tax=Gynuella sunshinyii YC6258 TaxID=1445510 RepID=A0A0C5VK71_9GAMM|nr:alkyl hydroperoxide reductase subunit F [Gynuella sunshinyii]AJQ93748.1 alkyl hydroperoxide reductase, large subunit [Gynuella sunshinyii YC6258]